MYHVYVLDDTLTTEKINTRYIKGMDGIKWTSKVDIRHYNGDGFTHTVVTGYGKTKLESMSDLMIMASIKIKNLVHDEIKLREGVKNV